VHLSGTTATRRWSMPQSPTGNSSTSSPGSGPSRTSSTSAPSATTPNNESLSASYAAVIETLIGKALTAAGVTDPDIDDQDRAELAPKT